MFPPPLPGPPPENRFNEIVVGPTDVKRQHYVPRMYLRRFEQAGKLDVTEIDGGRTFSTSTANAAVESQFNDLLNIDGERISTEAWLADIEGSADPVITKLVADPETISSLSNDEEIGLARFLGSLIFRVPAFREQSDQRIEQVVTHLKTLYRNRLFAGTLIAGITQTEAEHLWAEWDQRPDHWWMQEEAPSNHAVLAALMLSETQGWANLLRAQPWRIGRVRGDLGLYTSDNPLAGYLTPIRPWRDQGGLMSTSHWIPLDPTTLFVLERRIPTSTDDRVGPRYNRDFSLWTASFVRHLVSKGATRYVFGTSRPVPRDCAERCLVHVDRTKVEIARRYSGFDPTPPRLE